MSTMQSLSAGKQQCSGAVLLLAMVFLLLLSILGGTSMRASILEFRMSGNQLFKEEAFQVASALVSAISDNEDNFPNDLPAAHALCKAGNVSRNCVGRLSLSVFPREIYINEKAEVTYKVERMQPMFLHRSPMRLAQHSVSSTLAFQMAIFEIHAGVGGNAQSLGHAQVVQGVAKTVTASPGNSAE